MNSRSSFRTRLAVQTMIVAGVVLAAFGTASWWYARQQLARDLNLRIAENARRLWGRLDPRMMREDVAEALQGSGKGVLVLSNAPPRTVWFSENPALAGQLAAFEQMMPQRDLLESAREELDRRGFRPPPPGREPRRGGGEGVLRRPHMPEIREPVFFPVDLPDGRWTFGGFSGPHLTLFVGIPLSEFHAEVRQAAAWYIAAGAIGLVLSGIGAWWSSGRAMRPLDRIVATAQHLTANDLSRRIPIGPRDDREFAQLIEVLNGMMNRLQKSFEQAARFTADASHELKTPLAVMQVSLHDALRRSPPGSQAHAELESIARECARLKGITHSLLLLSQADAGKLPLQRERYDLSHDLARLVEDADAICEQAELRCEHYLEPSLHIDADRALMRHVFQNLLSNAVKYNRPNGLVKISLAERGRFAEFTICNTGEGIPEDARPRLFERFFRAEVARSTDGAGLGLNIAFEFARANGAELRLVVSEPDHTCMQVRIPLSSVPELVVENVA